MSEIILEERTRQLLDESLLDGKDVDAKIRVLIEAEYLRRLQQYQTQKHGLSFDEFVAQRVVAQRGYTWDVEQDAMDWETAIGGIATLERKLQQLREADAVHEG